MTEKEILVLARFVYTATLVLHKRFPSIKIEFHQKPTGELLLFVDVSKEEDYGDRCINPEPSMNDALTGFLESIGIRGRVFDHGKVFVSQSVIAGVSTLSFRTHVRWLKILSGGVSEIIVNLDRSLPNIPDGLPFPEVVIR